VARVLSAEEKAMLEADVRDPSKKLAIKHGVRHKRMHFGYGAAGGWPDDLFLFPDGHHWWVEFKRPGGKATGLQARVHDDIREFNGDVSVIDGEEQFTLEFHQRAAEHTSF
jgi:hypothetical protein